MPGHTLILGAIKAARTRVRWKPGSAISHLHKRKLRGHLPSTATLEDYERIILAVLQDNLRKCIAIGTTAHPMWLSSL